MKVRAATAHAGTAIRLETTSLMSFIDADAIECRNGSWSTTRTDKDQAKFTKRNMQNCDRFRIAAADIACISGECETSKTASAHSGFGLRGKWV